MSRGVRYSRVCGECGKRISGGWWGFDPNKWAYRQYPFEGHRKGLYFCSWHCLRAWQAADAEKKAREKYERRMQRMGMWGTTKEKRVKVRELLEQGLSIDEIKREVHCGYVLVKEVTDEMRAEQQAGELAELEEPALEKSPGGVSAETAQESAQEAAPMLGHSTVTARRLTEYESDWLTVSVCDTEQYAVLQIDPTLLDDDTRGCELHIDKRRLLQIALDLKEIAEGVCGTI